VVAHLNGKQDTYCSYRYIADLDQEVALDRHLADLADNLKLKEYAARQPF
jgi:hypothetical protein